MIEAGGGAEVVEIVFVLALEDAIGQGEGEELVELGGGILLEPGAEALVGVAAGSGIEQDGARLGEEFRAPRRCRGAAAG